MKSATRIVQDYGAGKITFTDLMLDLLSLVNEKNVHEIMSGLPKEIIPTVMEYVKEYRPGLRVTRGKPAAETAVGIVARWLEQKAFLPK